MSKETEEALRREEVLCVKEGGCVYSVADFQRRLEAVEAGFARMEKLNAAEREMTIAIADRLAVGVMSVFLTKLADFVEDERERVEEDRANAVREEATRTDKWMKARRTRNELVGGGDA